MGCDKMIMFYQPKGKFGFLANFSRHSIVVDGSWYKTVEHYYQSQKFTHIPHIFDKILKATTPGLAKHIAREHNHLRRADWNLIKETVMRRAIKEKFEQHPILLEKLLATADLKLAEDGPHAYWGLGHDGNGRNRIGRLLMCLRTHLAARNATSERREG